ncbi:MAG TPA: hypothetical protein VEX88_03910 [Glaciibacter sp.]|nr:hypothetical protein [Glaciibacter sp.]
MPTWTDPVIRAPRAWGWNHVRYAAGLALIACGVVGTVLSSTYSLWFLLAGPVVNGLGWMVLPGSLWRRIAVLLPCMLGGLLLLAGPQFAGGFALLVAGWLVVRNRPALSYLAVLLPVGASFASKEFLHDYSQNGVMLAVGAIISIGATWLAAWLATVGQVPSQSVDSLR